MARPALRFCIALNAAAVLSFLAFGLVPEDLDVRTDIIGYPTCANFNINRYFWAYGFTVVLFPLLAFGIYVALTRIFARSHRPRHPVPPPLEQVEVVPPVREWRVPLVAAGRTLLVGGVLGLEAAIILGTVQPTELIAASMLGYGVVALAVAWGASRVVSRDLLGVVSRVNTVTAALTVALLYGVSESTKVTVSATDAVHHYPWLPLWLAAALTAGVLAWLVRGLLRAASSADLNAVERRAVVLVVAPVALFILVAFLPGELGSINLFEEGQVLAAAELTREGAFPWRDLFVVHGLLHDVGTGLFGSAVIEDSRWGVAAGEQLLILPLSWVALYYLCVYLFGANWLFLLGTQLLIVTGQIFVVHYRLALIPFVLLLLAALLHRPTAVRAFAFTALLFVQAIVTPEALWAVPAYILVVVIFELYYRDRGRRLAVNLRRTWLVLTSAGLLAVVWSGFLLANGALDDFVFSYRAFVPGHHLTGGVPLGTYRAVLQPGNVGEHYEEIGILAPVLLILLAMFFFVTRTRLRRPLAVQDWVMLAAVAYLLPYYAKFLSRTDHVFHTFAMAVPVLLYAVYRVVTFVEAQLAATGRSRGASWFPARHVITLPVLLVLLASAPVPLADVFRSVPSNFAAEVTREPELDLLGYSVRGENDIQMFRDVDHALDSLLEPGEAVFDFSNTPGLFHYLAGRPASNRYYHVSIAIRQRSQTDLIRLLEKNRPRVIVFSAAGLAGAPSIWDKVANQVRHYDVSEYLLDRYLPVLESHSFVMMRRREDVVRARPDLYFHVAACDWGHSPNFFQPAPAPDSEVLEVPFRPLDRVLRIRGWAADPTTKRGAKTILVTRDGKVVARVRPDQRRPDVAYELSDSAYRDSGFGVVLPVRTASDADLERIRVYAVMGSGAATQLFPVEAMHEEGEPIMTGRVELDGRRVALVSDPDRGAVESIGVEVPLALEMPRDAAGYHWVEIRTDESLRKGHFEIVDDLSASFQSQRVISFDTLDRGETVVRVRVGACTQWRGYDSDVLYLTSSAAQDVRAVELLR